MPPGTGQLPSSHARRSRSPAKLAARLTKTVRSATARRQTVPDQLIHANSSATGDAPRADTTASRTAAGREGEHDFTSFPSGARARGGVVIALPHSPDAFKTATWAGAAPDHEDLAT